MFLSSTYELSDQVIGGVVQRVQPLHVRHAYDDEYPSQIQSCNYSNSRPTSTNFPDSPAEEDSSFSLPGYTSTFNNGQVALVPTRRKRWMSTTKRERSRINQARYRDRQRQHHQNVAESIHELRQEVQDLETKRQKLKRCTPTYTSLWTAVSEYFRVFRHGFKVPALSINAGETTTSSQQLDFLRNTMAIDVTDGAVSGAEALLESWWLMSVYHSDTLLQLKGLEQVAEDSLLATATVSVTVTEKTLRHAYPHLIRDDKEDGELPPLAENLLSNRLHICRAIRFDWDNASCRIVRLVSTFDIVSAMLKVQGNLENVARVLDKDFHEPQRYR